MNAYVLYSMLNPFIEAKYLTTVFSNEDFAIFRFLDHVYVGFFFEKNSSELPQGFLLTPTEAQLLLATAAPGYYLSPCDDPANVRLEFSDQLLAQCHTQKGQRRIRRRINKLGFSHCTDSMIHPRLLSGMTRSSVLPLLNKLRNTREYCMNMRKKYTKAVRRFSITALLMMTLFMSVVMTMDLRKTWNPDKVPAAFDKNGEEEVYVSVQADFVTKFSNCYTTNPDYIGGINWGTYYLYGNSETGQYGILKFKDITEEIEFSDEHTTVFPEPVTLYGSTTQTPYWIYPVEKPMVQQRPGSHIPSPPPIDPALYSPYLVDDYSGQAFRALAEHMDTDGLQDIGTVYIRASAHPEQEPLAINKAIDESFTLWLILTFICCGILIFKASKLDGYNALLRCCNSSKLILLDLLRESLPKKAARVSLQDIEDAIAKWSL